MSRSAPLPAEVRKARSFLFSHHKRGFRISPRQFASAAREQNVSFRELMHFISLLYARGQGLSTFRQSAIQQIAASGGTQ